jgi:hypothetical protein
MNFNLNGNYVDLIIIFALIYFVSEAWRYGFWILLADFLSFLLSLFISLRAYTLGSKFLESNFSLPHSVANALGFMLVATFTEAILSFIFAALVKKIPYKFWKKPWNNIAGIFPSLGRGLILISFVLTLVIGLPIQPKIKTDISNSRLGSYLVERTSVLEGYLSGIFGGLVEDSLTYLTTKQGSGESITLKTENKGLIPDVVSELQMVAMINEERRRVGARELTVRNELVPVARAHAEDMWKRNYFSHYSPEGDDVGDRLNSNGISYTLAGENLALAPTLKTAHTGLMNSEGHRENILNPDFRRIGIGVVENGYYGKMFVQIFTD